MFTPHVILLLIAIVSIVISNLFKIKDHFIGVVAFAVFAGVTAGASAFAAGAAVTADSLVAFAVFTGVAIGFALVAFAAGVFAAGAYNNKIVYKIFSRIFYIAASISIIISLIISH